MSEYYMFHKPAGYVTARHDAVEQTVMDFFPDFVKKKGTDVLKSVPLFLI